MKVVAPLNVHFLELAFFVILQKHS